MAWVEWIIELAQKIPSTFWGVVIGSFFSLLGVALTNRASARRLALQFSHERELRNTDRDLALRKDVYLSVVEAARAGSIVLGKLANLDIAQESLMDGYIDKSPAIAKVYIIAKEETVRVVADVEFALSDSILRLRQLPKIITSF